MNKQDQLRPVDFLKVSHHGSHTGTPVPALLDKILPMPKPSERPRRAVICTYEGTYGGVPDRELIRDELEPRCEEVRFVEKGTVPDGEHVDFEFEG